jgi:YVTN family beta-propeller protein
MYGLTSQFTTIDNYGGYVQEDEPSNAIVTNFGSNTVSILDLVNSNVIQTVPVGTQPIAVQLSGDGSKAYVANYGSSTISEVNLGTYAQTRVASVGAHPEALAGGSGTTLWVGGLNYISQLDVTSFSVSQTFAVSGQVTSIAVSSGQNSLIYTTVATTGGTTTFQAQQAAISSLATQGTYAQYTISSSSHYAEAVTVGGPAPGTPG